MADDAVELPACKKRGAVEQVVSVICLTLITLSSFMYMYKRAESQDRAIRALLATVGKHDDAMVRLREEFRLSAEDIDATFRQRNRLLIRIAERVGIPKEEAEGMLKAGQVSDVASTP
jgi:hypothetical protein